MLKIALAGNPNSGKTSLFNALTGAKQHVGNWPGVTVEQKTGQLKRHHDVEVVDFRVFIPYPLIPRKKLLHGIILLTITPMSW